MSEAAEKLNHSCEKSVIGHSDVEKNATQASQSITCLLVE
jgi:hypothetical protein